MSPKKPDPKIARERLAQAAYGAYAKHRALNKEWSHLEAEAKAAWMEASDEISAAILSELDQEETFLVFLKLAMRDALTDDHISQLQTVFVGRGGLPGRVRLIIAPDRISMPFESPLQGRHDG